MLRKLRHSDAILALFVIAIAALLLVPLPTPVLDVLLVLNLAVAFILLLAGLYMPSASALLAFPTLLLLTTLFRLALNVASTRLILSQGDAGRVIEAFGTFLIRDQVVVGMIIFVIVTIVNFVVIARGASRVSEVAARFTLDALPGRQMNIDSDLRAGLITPEEAQHRREDLRKESQLYGAMDGGMRFVQGDAIAGFFIIVTNILGGLYMGVWEQGMTFADAVRHFIQLTVGDGLLHQIPALLISICAGIVVTRVSSGEHSTLGSEVQEQLFTKPGTLLFVGGILVAIGVLTQLPALPFIAVGLVVGGLGILVLRKAGSAPESPALRVEYAGSGTALLGAPPASDDERREESPLLIGLDGTVLFKLYRLNQQRYQSFWRELQQELQSELGLSLPELRVVQDPALGASSVSISCNGAVVFTEAINLDSVLVDVHPESLSCFGLELVAEAVHPVDGSRVSWVVQSPAMRRIAEAAELRTFDFMEFVALQAAVFLMRHPEEILGAADVHASLRQLDKRFPGFLQEAVGEFFPSVSRVTEVLRELLREGVGIRDFRQLVEVVASYCSERQITGAELEQLDSDDLLNHVRIARKRTLLGRLLTHRRTLKVYTLSPEAESILESGEPSGADPALGIDPQQLRALRRGLDEMLDPLRSRGVGHCVVIVGQKIRARTSRLLRGMAPGISVLAVEELDPSFSVEPVGIWRAH